MSKEKFNTPKSIIFPIAATIITLAHCGVFIKKIMIIQMPSNIKLLKSSKAEVMTGL